MEGKSAEEQKVEQKYSELQKEHADIMAQIYEAAEEKKQREYWSRSPSLD